MRYQIDEVKLVVRAKDPSGAVAAIPELDEIIEGSFSTQITQEKEGVFKVYVPEADKTYTVRETKKCEFQSLTKESDEDYGWLEELTKWYDAYL